MARKKVEYLLDLAVAFGNLSVGDKTARIGITVDRQNLKVLEADKHLCERRLTCKLVARPKGENPDQGRMPGFEKDNDEAIDGVADVKGFSVSADHISFGLTFAIASIDIMALTHFAKRSGQFMVEGAEDIPEDEKKDDDTE